MEQCFAHSRLIVLRPLVGHGALVLGEVQEPLFDGGLVEAAIHDGRVGNHVQLKREQDLRNFFYFHTLHTH